ncbi:hypothetical protein [Streptomyces sp. NPDC056242]
MPIREGYSVCLRPPAGDTSGLTRVHALYGPGLTIRYVLLPGRRG